MQRVLNFIKAVELYIGKEPDRVVVFAEDYDALQELRPRAGFAWLHKLERGPSIQEYL